MIGESIEVIGQAIEAVYEVVGVAKSS